MAKSAGSASVGASSGGNVYRVIEIVGTSQQSLSDAIDTGIARASKTLHQLRWFEVDHISGHIADGKVAHYQVKMKVGFTMDDPE
jgi:flavin-binding protein dodecin